MVAHKIDALGVQKLKTLAEAATQLQRLHGIVERYALALKRSQPTSPYGMQVRRTIAPLMSMLKPHFGPIADQVAALNLVYGRGGTEAVKVRQLREGVGSLRMALDAAEKRVKVLHTVEMPSPRKAPSASETGEATTPDSSDAPEVADILETQDADVREETQDVDATTDAESADDEEGDETELPEGSDEHAP